MALVATGTYTGGGRRQRIRLDFEPDLVFVIPTTAKKVHWKNGTCWHGRDQFITSDSSEYGIGPYSGEPYAPFQGRGFSAEGDVNASGETYHYIAIKDNGDGGNPSVSTVGSATSGRAIDFADAEPDFVFVKRDSGAGTGAGARAAQIRWKGGASVVHGDYQQGTNSVYTLTSTGVLVTDSVLVNENNNAALGEGIEFVAFNNDGTAIRVTTYTGDGTANRAISLGHEATAAMIFDGVNDNTADTTRHSVVTSGMTAEQSKDFDGNAITTGVVASLGISLTLDAGFNVDGRAYCIVSFMDTAGVEVPRPDKRGTRAAIMPRGSGRLKFADLALSGPCTLEWYGWVNQPSDHSGRAPSAGTGATVNILTGLLMLGDGTQATNAAKTGEEYNGGIFLASTDPDGNGWRGEVIRIVHTDYWAAPRTESSINYYSLNTGIPFPYGRPVHLLVRHDGSGHWRLWIDGKPAKDYNVDLDQATYGNRTNGGAGIELGVHVNSVNIGDTRAQLGEMGLFRAAIWDTELSDADAASRVTNALHGTEYSGAAATVSYDYTGDTPPTAVESPNVTHGWHGFSPDYLLDSVYEGGGGAVASSATTTLSDIIPGDSPTKLRMIGVASWDPAAGAVVTIDSASLGGVAGTMIPDSSFTLDVVQADWAVKWFTVESGGGDLVVVSSAQPTAVIAGVWDISDIEDIEFLAIAAGANGSGVTTAAGTTSATYDAQVQGARTATIFGRAGGNQTFTARLFGETRSAEILNVGSTSMAAFGDGRVGSTGPGRVSALHAQTDTNGFMLSQLVYRTPVPVIVSGEILPDGTLRVVYDKPTFAGDVPIFGVSWPDSGGSVFAAALLSGNNTDTHTYSLASAVPVGQDSVVLGLNNEVPTLFGDGGPMLSFTNEPIENNAVEAGGATSQPIGLVLQLGF